MSTPNDDVIATLNPIAAAVARGLCDTVQDTVLTSGKRSLEATAAAVAADVAENTQFITNTYKKPLCAVAVALQGWVDAQGACLPAETYRAAFLAILGTFSADDLRKFSRHTTGDAFDIRPDGDPTKIAYLERAAVARVAAGGSALFLEREAGEIRWHWQGW